MVAFGRSKTLLKGNIEQKLLHPTWEFALFGYIDECLNVGYMHKSLWTPSLYIQGKGWYKGPRGEINANFQWEMKTNCFSPPHVSTNQVLQFHYLPISCCYKCKFFKVNVFVFQLFRKNCVTPTFRHRASLLYTYCQHITVNTHIFVLSTKKKRAVTLR